MTTVAREMRLPRKYRCCGLSFLNNPADCNFGSRMIPQTDRNSVGYCTLAGTACRRSCVPDVLHGHEIGHCGSDLNGQ
ncbi:hypothetical protein M5689_000614 [Euphorbia peplus]|nr:hypothetical protein M5689_000614 [Euphorbia peplus]